MNDLDKMSRDKFTTMEITTLRVPWQTSYLT